MGVTTAIIAITTVIKWSRNDGGRYLSLSFVDHLRWFGSETSCRRKMECTEDKWHQDRASCHMRDTRQEQPGCSGHVKRLNTPKPHCLFLQEPSEEVPEATWVQDLPRWLLAAGRRDPGWERNGQSAICLAACLQESTAMLAES